MSGHSKWAKVKHQKAVTDAVKGKIFTKLARAITIAVKEGGGDDPSFNFRLRLAIEKAKSSNVPKENIERAIEKGTGATGGSDLQTVVYEGYGPEKVGIIIEAATDNTQRTASLVKNVLDKAGGVMTAQGAVSYQFHHIGIITVVAAKGYDEMLDSAIEAGAQDLKEIESGFEIYTEPSQLHKVKENLEKKGISISNAELIYKPENTLQLSVNGEEKLHDILDSLHELDDVQKVYVNAS